MRGDWGPPNWDDDDPPDPSEYLDLVSPTCPMPPRQRPVEWFTGPWGVRS